MNVDHGIGMCRCYQGMMTLAGCRMELLGMVVQRLSERKSQSNMFGSAAIRWEAEVEALESLPIPAIFSLESVSGR